jgi:hypothetical protein
VINVLNEENLKTVEGNFVSEGDDGLDCKFIGIGKPGQTDMFTCIEADAQECSLPTPPSSPTAPTPTSGSSGASLMLSLWKLSLSIFVGLHLFLDP